MTRVVCEALGLLIDLGACSSFNVVTVALVTPIYLTCRNRRLPSHISRYLNQIIECRSQTQVPSQSTVHYAQISHAMPIQAHPTINSSHYSSYGLP